MKIRKARIEDCTKILELINDLALFEKEPEAVKLSVEDLKRDGFGKDPLFHCLIAEEDEVIGFSLYFFTWSTWEGKPSLYLEDLFIKKEARGKGAGLALLKELAKIAVDKNCNRFEWSVLDWNDLARDFYHSIGARHQKGWLPYRIEGDALNELAGITKKLL